MLLAKVKLLIKILLIKYHILKLVWVAKPIELNEYSKELLDKSTWEYLGGIKYKKVIDPTGDYRFYIPILDDNLVWRIDFDYSFNSNDKVPMTLSLIANKDGLKNDG